MDENSQNKYDGWIVSDSLLKRSLAIYGHSLLGALIIMVSLWIFFFIIALIIGFSAGIAG